MSKIHTKSEIEFIRTLKSLTPKNQSNIIKFLNTEGLDLIGECFHNIVSTNLKLSAKDKLKLKKKLPGNEKIINYIKKKNNPIEGRRKKLLQTGMSAKQ